MGTRGATPHPRPLPAAARGEGRRTHRSCGERKLIETQSCDSHGLRGEDGEIFSNSVTNTAPRSRSAIRPSFAIISLPSSSEGAGNAGRPMRPIAACATIVVERTRVSQVTPESPGIPRAMVLRIIRALPGDRALLPPSPAKIASRELDASVGASGPHDFSVRVSSPVKRTARVHRIPRPAFRDVAQRPSEERDDDRYKLICAF